MKEKDTSYKKNYIEVSEKIFMNLNGSKIPSKLISRRFMA